MSKATELFYNTRVCPKCGGHQKNCEHFWAGHAVGQRFAEACIIELLEADGLNCDCDWCQINGDVPSQHHWRILNLIKGKVE